MVAQAVQTINPEAKLGIGPPITDGFYYDFDVEEPFTPEDLKAIEKEMDRIIRSGQRFVRRVVTEDEARDRTGRRAVQARTHRAQGRLGRRPVTRERASRSAAPSSPIYDNVDPKTGETVVEGPLPRPAPAATRA